MSAGHLAADHAQIAGLNLRVLLRITVLTSIPISIYGVLQYFGIDPWLTPPGYHFGTGIFTIVRPPATLGHAAYFATYLLFAACWRRGAMDHRSPAAGGGRGGAARLCSRSFASL